MIRCKSHAGILHISLLLLLLFTLTACSTGAAKSSAANPLSQWSDGKHLIASEQYWAFITASGEVAVVNPSGELSLLDGWTDIKEIYANADNIDAITLSGDFKTTSLDTPEVLQKNLTESQQQGTPISAGPYAEAQDAAAIWGLSHITTAYSAYPSYCLAILDDGRNQVIGSQISSDSAEAAKEWTDLQELVLVGTDVIGLTSDGYVRSSSSYSQEALVTTWENIVSITAGTELFGLCRDGTVKTTAIPDSSGKTSSIGAWNEGATSNWTDITMLSASLHHTVGLRADGTVVATGLNSSGQCDVSAWQDVAAIAACDTYTIGIANDGSILFAGVGFENADFAEVSQAILPLLPEAKGTVLSP